MPIYAIAVALRRFLSLHVLNLCFCVGCHILISAFDGFGDIIPQLLRLAISLFLERSS
jgi:hypothetical protein